MQADGSPQPDNRPQPGNSAKSSNKSSHKPQKQSHPRNPLFPSLNEQENAKGFLITCDKHKQKNAVKDAYNFLNKYIEVVYGDLEGEQITKQMDASNKQASLENELEAMKNRKGHQRILSNVETHVNCMVFISIGQQYSSRIEPTRVVEMIMKDVHKEGLQVSRYCHKILPAEAVFKAEHFRMLDKIDQLFLSRSSSEMKSWALNFKCRNNSKFNYKQVLGEIDKIARNYGHFVDIYYPQWTVCIEIVHHLMCLSIVENFKEYEEFRLHKKAPNLRAQLGRQVKQEGEQTSTVAAKSGKKQRMQTKRMEKSIGGVPAVSSPQRSNHELLNQKVQAKDSEDEGEFI